MAKIEVTTVAVTSPLRGCGTLTLRRFALPDTVWDMSMLAFVAGGCAITALMPLGMGHALAVASRDSNLHGSAKNYRRGHWTKLGPFLFPV